MVIDSPSAVVSQVVTKAFEGGGVSEGMSVMVRVRVSETVVVPSLAVSVRVMVVSAATCGAVNSVDSAVWLARVMFRGGPGRGSTGRSGHPHRGRLPYRIAWRYRPRG